MMVNVRNKPEFLILLLLLRFSVSVGQNSTSAVTLIANAFQETLANITCSYIGVGLGEVPCPSGVSLITNRMAQIQTPTTALNLQAYVNSFALELSGGYFKSLWSQFSEIAIEFQQLLRDSEVSNPYNGSNASCSFLPDGVYLSMPPDAIANCELIPSLAQYLISIAQQPFVRLQYVSILGDHLAVNVPLPTWTNVTTAPVSPDPRTLPWFVTASASRRDVVFIVEMTPSVRMGLDATSSSNMIAALQACLSVLAEEDLYQVLIGGYTDPAQSGLLLRATADNVAASAQWAQGTLADDLTTLTEGLATDVVESAWNVLIDSAAAGSTNGCLRSVVVITDGAAPVAGDPLADVARMQAQSFAQVRAVRAASSSSNIPRILDVHQG